MTHASLLLGAGSRRDKLIQPHNRADWGDLTTLDMTAESGCDIVWDMAQLPLPLPDDAFDEIHAYDVLEHMGAQGDWRFFFAQFTDFWRILKPNGLMVAICPRPDSPWAWGDPGHTRCLPPECLNFLGQPNYGKPPMTDYRPYYRADFDVAQVGRAAGNDTYFFVLKAIKPARIAA